MNIPIIARMPPWPSEAAWGTARMGLRGESQTWG